MLLLLLLMLLMLLMLLLCFARGRMFDGYQAYVVSSSGSDVWFRTILPIIRKQKASSNIFIKKEKKKKKKKKKRKRKPKKTKRLTHAREAASASAQPSIRPPSYLTSLTTPPRPLDRQLLHVFLLLFSN